MSIYYDVYPGSIYPNNIYDTYIYDPLIAYYEDELRKLMKKNYEELKAEFDRKMKEISKKIEKIGEKSFMMGVALGFSDITNEGDEIHDTIVKVEEPRGVEAADYVNEEEEDQIDDLDEYLDTPPDSPKMPQKTIQPKKLDEFKLEKPIEPKLRDFTLKKQGRPSNIARSKYLHAKKDYEERMKNYAKEYA